MKSEGVIVGLPRYSWHGVRKARQEALRALSWMPSKVKDSSRCFVPVTRHGLRSPTRTSPLNAFLSALSRWFGISAG